MSSRKMRIIGRALFAAVLLCPAAVAWACSPAPGQTLIVSPDSAPQRSIVNITGSEISPSAVIHWNAVNGPVVGEAATDPAGHFSAQVTVPQVEPGIYTLVVVHPSGEPARLPLEVIPSGDSTAASSTPSGHNGSAISQDLASAWSEARPYTSEEAAPSGSSYSSKGAMGLGAALALVGTAASISAGAALVLRRRRMPIS